MVDKERVENMESASQFDEYGSSGGIYLLQIEPNIVVVMENGKFVLHSITQTNLP